LVNCLLPDAGHVAALKCSAGVEITDVSLSDPHDHKYLERIRKQVERCKIFDDHGHFRVAWVTEGQFAELFGVGVGSNVIKRERSSRLALAVAAAVQRPDCKDWLASHAIRVEKIAFSVAGATDAPNGWAPQHLSDCRTFDTHTSQRHAARSRSPQRIPVRNHAQPRSHFLILFAYSVIYSFSNLAIQIIFIRHGAVMRPGSSHWIRPLPSLMMAPPTGSGVSECGWAK
jgi:hypothetical protein